VRDAASHAPLQHWRPFFARRIDAFLGMATRDLVNLWPILLAVVALGSGIAALSLLPV
jgi:hypothetical protein